MEIEGVIQWILKNPRRYPGLHQSPQPRTTGGLKPLEAASQLQIIWKATVEYIHEKLLQGRGVNIKSFGAFTFAIETEHPRISAINPSGGPLQEQRIQRKHLHNNTPVFVPDASFEYLLQRYHRKNPLDKPRSQHSAFQRGFQMIFCNPMPIAYSCFLGSDVVKDSHNAIFNAIKDLTKAGRSLCIKWNFAIMNIRNMALDLKFNSSFNSTIKDKNYEKMMRKSDAPCNEFWKTTGSDKWKMSTLSSLWNKPDPKNAVEFNQKTLALKIMSLDLSSALRPTTAL